MQCVVVTLQSLLLFAFLSLWTVTFDVVITFASEAFSLLTKSFAMFLVSITLFTVSRSMIVIIGVVCGGSLASRIHRQGDSG
jgi:hypothetical protein